MNRSFRVLTITGIAAVSLILVTTGASAQQRMGGGNAEYIARAPMPPRAMDGGPMGMHGGFHRGHMGDMDIMRLAERLNLTQDQRDKIGKIIDEARPKMRNNAFALMDNRKELHTLMKEDKPDDRKLRSLTRKQGELMADMMYLRIKMREDIHSVLTKEQLDKMKERRGMFFRRGMKGAPPPAPGENS